MMTKEQYFLTLVMEECAEVAHRASKAIRFGLAETQPGNPLNNGQRLMLEVIDLTETLNEAVGPVQLDYEFHARQRREKMDSYLERAIRDGVVAA